MVKNVWCTVRMLDWKQTREVCVTGSWRQKQFLYFHLRIQCNVQLAFTVSTFQKFLLNGNAVLCTWGPRRLIYTPTQWFSDVPVGVNKMGTIVKSICQKAGMEGYFMNHSLRATSATRMYQAGVPEKLICEVTGHRSATVREYQHMSTEQRKKVNAAIGKPCSF